MTKDEKNNKNRETKLMMKLNDMTKLIKKEELE